MKVALISFHDALNYGASLQIYAMQQSLKELGVDCEYIDYVNQYRGNAYCMSHHIKTEFKRKKLLSAFKYCVGIPFMSARRTMFEKFYKKNTSITAKKYTSSKEAEILNDKYDKFIVGSDQVWNYKNNGNDFAFFLDFVKDKNKKIAYSSSFGLATIPEDLKEGYIENLMQIKYLSTREGYGVKLIKDLTGRDAELVLDPVFLLDKKQWLSLCNNKRKSGKHIFCYTNRPSQLDNFLTQTGISQKGYKLHKLTRHLTVHDFINPTVKVSYSLSPTEFIETIATAELVVTASFHCVAMSIILNKPFVAILTGDKGKDERILNVLEIVGLKDRILDKNTALSDVNKPIDFQRVEKRIDEYKQKSLDFLKNAIFDGEAGE